MIGKRITILIFLHTILVCIIIPVFAKGRLLWVYMGTAAPTAGPPPTAIPPQYVLARRPKIVRLLFRGVLVEQLWSSPASIPQPVRRGICRDTFEDWVATRWSEPICSHHSKWRGAWALCKHRCTRPRWRHRLAQRSRDACRAAIGSRGVATPSKDTDLTPPQHQHILR